MYNGSMNAEIQGAIRAVAAGVAGMLATRGFIASSEIEVIIAVVMGIATISWSIYEKRKVKAEIASLKAKI